MATEREHYFDWAATASPDEKILREALEETLKNWGNPSSVHKAGTDAKALLTDTRKTCARILGVQESKIFFTSGGTESDHIALSSILTRPEKGTVLLSSLEHSAFSEMASSLEKAGIKVKKIPSDRDGMITAQAVKDALTEDTLFVAVMAVNNETGAIQPVYEIADTITEFYEGKRKAKFHVDCVQALGKIPLNISYRGIDSAAFSAHKISGPRGIGILYLANPVEVFLKGGGQESGIRSGTENLFGAVAFAKCMEKYAIPQDTSGEAGKRFLEQKKFCDQFIANLKSLKGVHIIPESRTAPDYAVNYSPWIVQASFQGIPGQVMVRALSAKGFYISTGSACSTKKQSRPILEAMSVPQEFQQNAVRFSFGPETTEKAMDDLFREVKEIASNFIN